MTNISYIIPDRYVPQPGETIDRYTVKKKIGEGSFGSIYIVKNNTNIYALKLLNLYAIASEEQRNSIARRFQLEYETGQIKNNYLVRSFDYGNKKGNPYFVMEFCPNGDLRNRLYEKLSVNEIEKIGVDILYGLKALHEAGKVHRDLKPENILFKEDKTACLTDFGISGHKSMRITKMRFGKPREVFGTYAYMPPEQIKPGNKHVTILPTTDIFSFGVTMYETFTRNLPFGALENESDLGEYVLRMNKGQWVPVTEYRNNVPDIWCSVIDKCLKPDYKQRFQNVYEILNTINKNNKKIPVNNKKKFHDNLGLKIMQGEDYGKTYNLAEIIGNQDNAICTIGRKDDDVSNNVEIKEDMTSYISRCHATIEKLSKPKGWYIRDGQFNAKFKKWNKSTNGTFVNSKMAGLNYTPISVGDIITLGDTTLKVISL